MTDEPKIDDLDMPGTLIFLWVIASLALVIGLFIVIIGWSLSSSYDGSAQTDSGIGELLWGGIIFGIGVLATFIAMGSQAVISRLDLLRRLELAKAATDRSASELRDV